MAITWYYPYKTIDNTMSFLNIPWYLRIWYSEVHIVKNVVVPWYFFVYNDTTKTFIEYHGFTIVNALKHDISMLHALEILKYSMEL